MVLTIVASDFARGQGDEGFQVQDGRRPDSTLLFSYALHLLF